MKGDKIINVELSYNKTFFTSQLSTNDIKFQQYYDFQTKTEKYLSPTKL